MNNPSKQELLAAMNPHLGIGKEQIITCMNTFVQDVETILQHSPPSLSLFNFLLEAQKPPFFLLIKETLIGSLQEDVIPLLTTHRPTQTHYIVSKESVAMNNPSIQLSYEQVEAMNAHLGSVKQHIITCMNAFVGDVEAIAFALPKRGRKEPKLSFITASWRRLMRRPWLHWKKGKVHGDMRHTTRNALHTYQLTS